jgi:hypothetical protein
VRDADHDTAMVLAACHSLVALPDTGGVGGNGNSAGGSGPKAIESENAARVTELLGDPIEVAGLRGVQWSFDPKSQISRPGDTSVLELARTKVQTKLTAAEKSPPAPGPNGVVELKAQLKQLTEAIAQAQTEISKHFFQTDRQTRCKHAHA